MRKILFCAFLLLFSAVLAAGDSGLYYNPDREGEGIDFNRSGDLVQFYFYTYDEWQGCPGYNLPESGQVNEDNCHENRWFLSGGDTLTGETDAVGFLYMPIGLDYPFCVPVSGEPFQVTCGESHIVGLYVLERSGDGWRIAVTQHGDILDDDDPLYDLRGFNFDTPLFITDG